MTAPALLRFTHHVSFPISHFALPTYFCEGVAVSMNRVKEAVLELSFDRRAKEQKGQIFLNERQMRILKHLQTNPRITISEIQEMFDISREMANRIIKVLLEQDLIARKGRGKATYYELL